jgi:hypothetical protein
MWGGDFPRKWGLRYAGLFFSEVAKKHPKIECISFDLPPVEPVAKKHIAAAGLTDRIRTASGNFFHDPLRKRTWSRWE